MRNVLLKISYDGTDFCGWQKQFQYKNDCAVSTVRTVQDEIEKVLFHIHKQPTRLQGSGRTDSGVHAHGQSATFYSPIDSIPVKNYVDALNSKLPQDIRIMDAEEKSESFNARFNATSRTYRYVVFCGDTPSAIDMRYAWAIRRYPDIATLNSMAECLRGEIDCTSFSSSKDQSLSKYRCVQNAHFFLEDEKLIFEIKASSFLWRMVRSITG
ncbi:MAG TPA: tRNA pseudouridine(38-40) synthase TruA, partial [Treponemataceae bacterium]|nr:tRNA pseudouridine(38-40) synthase TruA [Treponemataceae bacterium]